MRKKIVCVWGVLVMLALSCLSVSAEDGYGDICCWLQFGDQAVTDGSLEIYRAGEPVPEGYLLGQEFGGGIIAGEDIPSAAFAQWMSEKAGPGFLKKPNKSGMVRFGDLEPGIYLIRQGREFENYYPIEPYLACVSEELTIVDTYPELIARSSIPRTAQYLEVYLGSLGITLAVTGLAACYLTGKKQEG